MQIAGYISIFLLMMVMGALALNWKCIRQGYLILAIYCVFIFLYELSLGITAYYKVNNHFILNIHSLVYFPLAFFLLLKQYAAFFKKPNLVLIPQIVITAMILVGWILDNLIMGNLEFFNSMMPWFASILLTAGCIYMVNLLIFSKNSDFWKDPDVLILGGILVTSAIWTLCLWLMDFDPGFNPEFISNAILFINIGLCVSDVFFIFAIYRIGLDKKVKAIVR